MAVKLWEGRLELNSSINVAAVAFFKSGETFDIFKSGYLALQGKVKLDNVLKEDLLALPHARTKGLMVITICPKEECSEEEIEGLTKVLKDCGEGEMVAFSELSPGVHVYLCPRSDQIFALLGKYGIAGAIADVDDDSRSMLGLVVWPKDPAEIGHSSAATMWETPSIPATIAVEKAPRRLASGRLPALAPVPVPRRLAASGRGISPLPALAPVPMPRRFPALAPVPMPRRFPPLAPVPMPRRFPALAPVPMPRGFPALAPVPMPRRLAASGRRFSPTPPLAPVPVPRRLAASGQADPRLQTRRVMDVGGHMMPSLPVTHSSYASDQGMPLPRIAANHDPQIHVSGRLENQYDFQKHATPAAVGAPQFATSVNPSENRRDHLLVGDDDIWLPPQHQRPLFPAPSYSLFPSEGFPQMPEQLSPQHQRPLLPAPSDSQFPPKGFPQMPEWLPPQHQRPVFPYSLFPQPYHQSTSFRYPSLPPIQDSSSVSTGFGNDEVLNKFDLLLEEVGGDDELRKLFSD